MIVDLSVLLTVVVGFVTVNLGSVYFMGQRLGRRSTGSRLGSTSTSSGWGHVSTAAWTGWRAGWSGWRATSMCSRTPSPTWVLASLAWRTGSAGA